jgi:hypothetical protein
MLLQLWRKSVKVVQLAIVARVFRNRHRLANHPQPLPGSGRIGGLQAQAIPNRVFHALQYDAL